MVGCIFVISKGIESYEKTASDLEFFFPVWGPSIVFVSDMGNQYNNKNDKLTLRCTT